MFDAYTILTKSSWRSDRIWTAPFFYNSILKYIPLFFDTWALLKSQYWSRAQLDALRDARIRSLLRDAINVRYWKDVIEKSDINAAAPVLEQLRALPITSKNDLLQYGADDIADSSLIARSDPDHTSGSTGRPFNFFQDWHASLRSFAVTERVFRSTDAARWPIGKRAPVVYMRSRARNGFTFHRHIWFFLRAFSAVPHRMHDMAALGRKLKRGFILYGYTSWVVELVRQMEKLQLQLPLRSVMVAGEHLSGPDRAFIERITGVELYELYASRETGFLGYECHLHKMHVSEEWAFLEIVDAEGQPLPPGHEGRIIVTTFDNRVMPFIRYDIGDRGVISPNPCACGRTLRTLEFKGRTAELIELEDNRVVSLLDVAYAMGHMHDAVRQYQLVQTSAISFVIKIVPGPRFDTAKEELEQILVRLLHPRVQIEWEIVEDIPAAASGKAAYFVRDFKRTT